MRPYALFWLYRRRLRAHRAQEMLAGVGVAIAVALVFATMVAAGVYMLCRVYFILNVSPEAMHVIAWIGAITSLMADL